MFRVVNNKIYIGRGETPVYEAHILHEDSTPFRIIKNSITDPTIVFIVKDGLYSNVNEFRLRLTIPLEDIVEFTDYSVSFINTTETGVVGEEGKLYRDNDNYSYHYWDGDSFKPYSFKITIPFLYEYTSELPAKRYWYEISLLGGQFVEGKEEVKYKKTLIEPTEFIVEGRLSE